jgi:hypothetical protein
MKRITLLLAVLAVVGVGGGIDAFATSAFATPAHGTTSFTTLDACG